MANKKKTRKFVGLSKRNFKRHVRDFVDQDYLHKLSLEEKEWLSKFNDEYYNGNFDDAPFHETKELQRECWTRRNKAEADIISNPEIHIVILEEMHERKYSFHDDEYTQMIIDLMQLMEIAGAERLTQHALRKAYERYNEGNDND